MIFVGGQGSRMQGFAGNLPKSLIDVNGESLLRRQLRVLKENGVGDIHLLLGNKASQIINYVLDLPKSLKSNVFFTIEHKPLGTGGALYNFLTNSQEEIGALHGDLYIDTDLARFISVVDELNCDWGQIVHPSNHVYDSDVVVINQENLISKYVLKPHASGLQSKNRTNAGIYYFKNNFIKTFLNNFNPRNQPFDLDRQVLPTLIEKNLVGYAFENLGTCVDVGTPDRLERLRSRLGSKGFFGIKRPMVFLDRDGVINKDSGWISNLDSFFIYPEVPLAIRKLNDLGIRVVVVTNQPVVARGDITFDGLREIHNFLESQLAKHGAFVNDILICPHHPNSGFPNEVEYLKRNCECRKPKVGNFLKALKLFPTDLSKSHVIGDTWRDAQAAFKLGIDFLPTRKYQPSGKDDVNLLKGTYIDLNAAVDHIVDKLV